MANTAIYTSGTWVTGDKRPVARVSKVKDDAHIYDVLDTVNALPQGANIKVGGHLNGSLQTRAALTPSIGDKIAFVCDAPLIYKSNTTLDQAEYNFINKEGKITKAYEVGSDDVIGVSDYGITKIDVNTDFALDQLIVVDGSRGWKALATGTAVTAYGFVAKVIGFERYQFDRVVLFEVIRNAAV